MAPADQDLRARLRELERKNRLLEQGLQQADRNRRLWQEALNKLKAAQRALKESESRFRVVAEFTYDWEYWVRADGSYAYISPSVERITGYSHQEFLDDPGLLERIVHRDDRERVRTHLRALLSADNADPGVLEFRIVTRDGEERWMGHVCQPVFSDQGTYLGRRGSNRDISRNKQLEQKLECLATHDSLTSLYNRGELDARLAQELERARRYQRPLSLLVLDIDHFKSVNDTHGHQAGDEALRHLGATLANACRQLDIVARYGGDEFVVVMPEALPVDARGRAESLCRTIADRPLLLGSGQSLSLSISIGISAYPEHGETPDQLLAAADHALYAAKAGGRNRMTVAGETRDVLQGSAGGGDLGLKRP